MKAWRALGAVVFGAIAIAPAASFAEIVDRVVAVFDSPETGGPYAPQVVFARELGFEARLEALASGEPIVDGSGEYAERHVRAALDRHIATELLSRLPVERDEKIPVHPCDAATTPDATDLERRLLLARNVLVARVHGPENLYAAAEAESVSEAEIARIIRREALAARYLDLMVTPMLAPSDVELRDIHRTTPTPFRGRPFDEVRCDIRRFVIGQRLAIALAAFLQSSRSRVHLRIVAPS